MKTNGIRISDGEGYVTVELIDILQQVKNGDQFYWSILFIDAVSYLKDSSDMFAFQEEVNELERGFFINWKDLNAFSKKCGQVIDIMILGTKDKNLILRYEDEQDAYEACDIVIQMIDSSYWQVFSKDEDLICRLGSKFKKIEYINSNYLEVYLNRKAKGIKIEDVKQHENSSLSEILYEIGNDDYSYWSILSMNATYEAGEELPVKVNETINERKNGCFISWDQLKLLATLLKQVTEMTILGSPNSSVIKRYEDEQEQYDSCETVIKRVDDAYWIVFSKDESTINRLGAKFNEVEYLDSDYMKKL
jgi:hypothetical protein